MGAALLLVAVAAGVTPVATVRFEGNQEIASAALDALVAQLGPALATPDGLARLPLLVAARYFDEGFIEVRVESAQRAPDGALVVAVHEGRRYRVGKISFTGRWPLPPARLSSRLATRPAEVFSRACVTGDLARLRRLAKKNVLALSSIDQDHLLVDLVFEVD